MLSDTVTLVAVIALVVDIVIRIIAIIVVPRNRRPSTGLAWLMAIFLIPYVGVIAFLLLGSFKLPKRRREKQLEVNHFILDATRTMAVDTTTSATASPGRLSPASGGTGTPDASGPVPPWFDSVVTLNRNLGALPLVSGNDAHLFGDYEATIRRMAAAIDDATSWVHVEFYILACDETTVEFFDALDRAVARGVEVRILLDHIAAIRVPGFSRDTLPRLKKIGEAGGHWRYMLPVRPWRGEFQRPDLRNHRKLLVIDGTLAYMGSQNVIDSSYNKPANKKRGLHWLDLMVRLEGPIVHELNAVFMTDWYSETDEIIVPKMPAAPPVPRPENIECQAVPSGPGFEGENNLRLFLTLLFSAQKSIIITSPYFVPDESMLYAITTAASRGVHVELFVSEIGDQALVYHAQRSYYEALLKSGVRIWMYSAPTILHSKHFTIDDEVAVIGSSNMDMRSFSLNLEVSLMVRSATFVEELREVQQDYRDHSRELTAAEWAEQPLRSTVLDNLARLTAALQ